MTKINSSPNYISHNGHRYEKVSSGSVEVSLDLEETVLEKLNALVEQGTYVSLGDAVRDILRTQIREATKKPKQPKGPKKPPNAPKQPNRPPQKLPQRRGR